MQKQKYSKEWFIKRAKDSFKKIDRNTWDYSDSLLLYLPTGEELYESIQQEDTVYHSLVTRPEHEYLKDVATNIVSNLPQKFAYIDLGPGTEHKEQIFFDEFKKQQKDFVYIPVDINLNYLHKAKEYSSEQGIETIPIQSSFEELHTELSDLNLSRVVNIGLTFSNYHPQEVLRLLKVIAGKDGHVLLNSQIRNRVDMVSLMEIYGIEAKTLTDDKLALLGFDSKKDVSERWADDGFRVWCTSLKDKKELGVKKGDKILLFQSLRYSKERLEEELAKAKGTYTLFDNESSFITALVKS